MSNYSILIVSVKKLQFPQWKTNKFENVGKEGGREGGNVSCYQEESQWPQTLSVWLAILSCWHVSSPLCDVVERRACETFKNYRQHYEISLMLGDVFGTPFLFLESPWCRVGQLF